MEKSAEILEAEMTILQARLEITEQEAHKEIARLEQENKALKARNTVIARELEWMKERAEHAEKMWAGQYKLSTDAAYELQRERHNSAQIGANCIRKFMRDPRFVIAAFCEFLGIQEKEFFANLNLGWAEKINRALAKKDETK